MDVTTGSLAVLSEKLERYDERDDLFFIVPRCLAAGVVFYYHACGKEQNGQRIISEEFTFLTSGTKLFPVSHRSQAQSCRPATTSSQMLQSFFAFSICLPRRYGLFLNIQACERCDPLFLPRSFVLNPSKLSDGGLVSPFILFRIYCGTRSLP